MNRSALREIIIKVLYQVYIYKEKNLSYELKDIIKENLEAENEFVTTSIKEVIKREEKLNSIANKYMKDWSIDRVSKVDKAIISLAIYELLYTDTPDIVAINEAIELSKKYSDEKVVKLINGMLDSIMKGEKHE